MKVFIVCSKNKDLDNVFENLFEDFEKAEAWVNDMYDKGFSLELVISEFEIRNL